MKALLVLLPKVILANKYLKSIKTHKKHNRHLLWEGEKQIFLIIDHRPNKCWIKKSSKHMSQTID